MLEHVLKYAKMGWKITPPVGKNKVPTVPRWQEKATNNPAILTDWYKRTTGGVGVLCGKTSGVLVIDLDVVKVGDPEGTLSGSEQLELIEMDLGIRFPRNTVCERTQGGGYHYFFKYPSNREIRKSKMGKIDVLGDGAYCMIAPSVGEKGSYEWINSPFDTELLELPEAFLDVFDKTTRVTAPAINPIVHVKSTFEAPELVPQGARDDTLTRYVGALVYKTNNYDELLGQAMEYNRTACKPPLSDRDVTKIVNSVVTIHNRKMEAKVEASTGERADNINWLTLDKGRYVINEPLFATWFIRKHNIVFVNEKIYDMSGHVTDGNVKSTIQEIIAPYIPSGLDAKVKGLLNVVKNQAFMLPPPINKFYIHFKDTTYDVRGGVMKDVGKQFSLFRFNHRYNPNAGCPNWLKFLDELMMPDDVRLLQKYMGYCMVPQTTLQQALFICGNGGEGKSRISVILSKIFENNIVMDSINGIESDKFMFATLDNKLLFVDDDMTMSAFDETEKLKKLIVAETKMQLEPKGLPKYEAPLFTRIVGIGNGFPQAKYDKSDGFARRIRPIRVKPVPENRVINRQLQDTLNTEIEGIIAWAIDGLLELIKDKYDLKTTKRQDALQEEIEMESNTIKAFILDDLMIVRGEDKQCGQQRLYRCYENWCHDMGIKPNHQSTFNRYLKSHQTRLRIQYSDHIVEDGKRTRGFKGIECVL